MEIGHMLFGERSLTKVAATFESRMAAEEAARQLRHMAGMNKSQVTLVGPDDRRGPADAPLSRKLEPEQAGIWRTLIRAHLVTGALGVLAGALTYFGFRIAGNAAVESSPFLSVSVMLFFGGIFGLLLGGLLSLRPDHYRVMAFVRKAIRRGRWAVVSHPVNAQQTSRVINALHARHREVVRSF